MAGIASEESFGRSIEGISSGLQSQSGESLAEWRSSEQLENGTSSTSPPYWDSDEDYDSGPKPSELYGKYTWKIDNFSQLNKRELRSNAFEVGAYKWYILIYPHGCDVCNHLSLFLCVANHDRLLPGWSHFAQFTIAVVNKDPKKSKYSDTLHRFWKKEHDWGWKKFMERSKVLDGFVEADTLIIKAQVQVIRERAEQPFRCLDCQYRKELIRVHLTNVEQICRRFVEERRSKIGKLIEDKHRWLSFCTFWLGIDQSARRCMTREKTNAILKVVIKHFFIEKEVTSTLVMDSLYSGLRALEGQTMNRKVGAKLLEAEEMPAPIVRIEKDMFVLVDDVLLLLERAALEPLPPKDEKGPQNRIKEGSSGEDFNKDSIEHSIERDERRLTELGRRTVEIFVLAHIYSNKVEVAYQEAVAFKRQEELIREEEAAWQAESEQKARRGATEKEKKAKKKQAKQKRNIRKGREKGREERIILDRVEKETLSDMKVSAEEMQPAIEKPDMVEDVSDVSDSVDAVGEALHPDSEDRETSPVNWDTDTSEIHPPTDSSRNATSSLSSAQTLASDKKIASMMDDSSSTCSTDSVPSVVMNGSYKGSSFPKCKNPTTLTRRKNQQGNVTSETTTWGNVTDSQPSGPSPDTGDQSDVSETSKLGESEPEAAAVFLSHQDQSRGVEQEMAKKEKGMVAAQRKQSPKNQVDRETTMKDKMSVVTSSIQNTQIYHPKSSEQKSEHRSGAYIQKTSSNGSHSRAAPAVTSPPAVSASKSDAQKALTPKITEKVMVQQASMMSRPSNTPLIPALRHLAPVVSVPQTTQPLSCSASAAGRLGPDPLPATHSYAPPQSYRNAMMGNNVSHSTNGFTQTNSLPDGVNPSSICLHPTALVSPPMLSSQNWDGLDSSFPLGMVTGDGLPNVLQWTDGSQMDGRSVHFNTSSLNDVQNLECYPPLQGGSREQLLADFSACTSGRQGQGLGEEFPHLDIINDLLDEEQIVGKAAGSSSIFPSFSHGPILLNRQFSLPGNIGLSGDVGSSTSSCRFERTHSYHDVGFGRGYGSRFGHFEPGVNYMPPVSALSYVSGQMDGISSSQWQINLDRSLLQSMNSEYKAYPYLSTVYSDIAYGISGYNVFLPSSNGN